MRTFYITYDKNLGMKILETESLNYLERVGAVISTKELYSKKVESVSVGDILFSPEHGTNWEVVTIK